MITVLFFFLQSIWGILRENGVSIKALVAVLSFYVLGAKTKAANTQHRVRGLYAASLYLLLLKIPGKGALVFELFYSNIAL